MKMLSKVYLHSSLPRHSACAAVCGVNSRPCSEDMRVIRNLDTAFLKRGTGGRSSFNGIVATVFGATGFFGHILCNQLGKRGTQLIIPYRCDSDEEKLKELKLCGDLGQVLFQPFDLRDPVSIKKAIKYSNVVVNLIGAVRPSRNFKTKDVNVKGARTIARACKELNIERLIHFSTLNVNVPPKRYYLLKLDYNTTKKEGEEAVLEEFPMATIFRPAPMYNYFDHFLWTLLSWDRIIRNSTGLYKKGEKTIKQPVFANDVSLGVINAINDYDTRGKIYQAVGPERFYLKDIFQFCCEILQRPQFYRQWVHDIHWDVFTLVSLVKTRLLESVGTATFAKLENIELESETDVVDRNLPTLIDLGVKLTKMEDKVPYIILKCHRCRQDIDLEYEEFMPASSLSAKALSQF